MIPFKTEIFYHRIPLMFDFVVIVKDIELGNTRRFKLPHLLFLLINRKNLAAVEMPHVKIPCSVDRYVKKGLSAPSPILLGMVQRSGPTAPAANAPRTAMSPELMMVER
jgi:hypothetical protein